MIRKISDIKKIILHCSDSAWGNAAEIDEWHRARGFSKIGYHYVIGNGHMSAGGEYQTTWDGRLEIGRALTEVGAHCRGHNRDSVGICLIGKHHFSARQMFLTLPKLLKHLLSQCTLDPTDVYGHREFNPHKTCPNFDAQHIRDSLVVTEMCAEIWDGGKKYEYP